MTGWELSERHSHYYGAWEYGELWTQRRRGKVYVRPILIRGPSYDRLNRMMDSCEARLKALKEPVRGGPE